MPKGRRGEKRSRQPGTKMSGAVRASSARTIAPSFIVGTLQPARLLFHSGRECGPVVGRAGASRPPVTTSYTSRSARRAFSQA